MTAPIHDGELAERAVRWFDAIPATTDPWLRWLEALPARRLRGHTPFDAGIEYDVERLIEDADRLRLSITPKTKHFAEAWAAYRHYHDTREHTALGRRLRYLVWRAAALSLILWRGRFQDVIDANKARELLETTFADISPDLDCGGFHKQGGGFWQIWMVPDKDGKLQREPLSEYAVMTLSIVKSACTQ